jgi:mannose-6-phosphate isomerase-like protein (cupin superfamily)
MNVVDIPATLQKLRKLDINDRTTHEDADAAMSMLGDFNRCVVGVVHFSGATPWECHPDDELLQVREGEVRVTIVSESATRELTLQAGEMYIIPANLWHKQFSPNGVKMLYITSREGNQHSTAEEPPSIAL